MALKRIGPRINGVLFTNALNQALQRLLASTTIAVTPMLDDLAYRHLAQIPKRSGKRGEFEPSVGRLPKIVPNVLGQLRVLMVWESRPIDLGEDVFSVDR